MNEPLRNWRRFGRWAPVLGLAAVIIIAVAMVASGPGPQGPPAAPVSAPDTAANAPKSAPFHWHEAPPPAPGTVFKDAVDADRTLADFAGKVLVVNFWATWCGPCVKEMPMLDGLQAKLGGDAFQVLAISQDREGAKVAKPFVEANGWKNLALYTESPGRFAKDANLRGLPTSLIIDKTGREVARVEGEVNWMSAEVEERLRALVAAP